MTDLIRSPLHDRHLALGAKLAPFGGWEMPLEYAGVLAEHKSVREAVGVFDVSHLGKGRVSGAGAAEFVNQRLSNDLGRVGPGKAQYTLCCNEAGGVLDDLIAYLVGPDEVFLVPNAANSSQVVSLLAAEAPAGLTVTDRHTDLAVLAVQGPESGRLLARLGVPVELPYMSFTSASVAGVPVTLCRTGYTGELGFELLPPAAEAGLVWDAVVGAGAVPCGLGARDTLRTEMGYPLHGQDLSPEISPLQARAGWAVGWDKPRFWGREALLRERAAGPRRLLSGLLLAERGVPRPHMAVSVDGQAVGEVTSGTFSPTRRAGIALALLDSSVELGSQVSVDVRGRPVPAEVVRPPFVPSRVR